MLAPGLVNEAEAAAHSTRALDIAASKKGSPYRYGASGPHRFDCSGLTLYSFKKAGKKLPRTAQQQYNKTRHISSSQRRRGDLVFFHAGRSVYHVGIYAAWAARSGTRRRPGRWSGWNGSGRRASGTGGSADGGPG